MNTRKHRKTKKAAKTIGKSAQDEKYYKGRSFRLLAFQPLSLMIKHHRPFVMSIRGIKCNLALRSAYADENAQRTHGGMYIAVDFSLEGETELLPATQQGLDLIEDFLSAVSLVNGATFREVEPIQIVCTDRASMQEYTLVHFLGLSMHHWEDPFSHITIDAVRRLLAHWDGLDSGNRLRRAARQFRNANGTDDDTTAFQYAYMGLEALEKPLALAMNIEPGVEVTQGKCEQCGFEYTRRKTVLAGVRSYICGAMHTDMAIPERKREWKKINDLRHGLFHSLRDSETLEHEARDILPAVMHHLHDALCCLSHSHSLESPTFKLARRMHRLVFVGQFRSAGLGRLEECRPLLSSEKGYWASHPEHGSVPRFLIRNPGLKDLGGIFFWINATLRGATGEDLFPANWEENQDGYEQ